jgi:hypothetical protein
VCKQFHHRNFCRFRRVAAAAAVAWEAAAATTAAAVGGFQLELAALIEVATGKPAKYGFRFHQGLFGSHCFFHSVCAG